jgi:hypothetical protein
MNSAKNASSTRSSQHYRIVHRLDDLPEPKRDVSALGAMPMTPRVRLSLLALRGYLILMAALVAYHFLGRAAALKHLST